MNGVNEKIEYKEIDPGCFESIINGFDIYITEQNDGSVILDIFDSDIVSPNDAHIRSEEHVSIEAAKKAVQGYVFP